MAPFPTENHKGRALNRLTPMQHHDIKLRSATLELAKQAGRFIVHMLEGKGVGSSEGFPKENGCRNARI
jgi:hypothetical protein